MKNQEQIATEFVATIKELVSRERNFDNFECYLCCHFSEWLKKFASTPESKLPRLRHLLKWNFEYIGN